jgi:CheY-like chemotaxis protein
MLIDITTKDAEGSLLLMLEQPGRSPSAWGALHFQFSTLRHRFGEDEILMTIRPVLADRKAALYRFHDGDIVITWSGVQKAVLETLRDHLYARFQLTEADAPHAYYDLQAHGEELRLLCKQKIAKLEPESLADDVAPLPPPAPPIKPAPEQLKRFQRVSAWRPRRDKTEILVVEDQPFSSKLLRSMLDRTCKAHTAATAEQALEWYLGHAPDIVFLDIELPGMDGHQFAGTVTTFDPQAFIIMVTANNRAGDVARAKHNGARAFVTKPFSKRKIYDCIRKFREERRNTTREVVWKTQ